MDSLSSEQICGILTLLHDDPEAFSRLCEAISMSIVDVESNTYLYMEKIGALLQHPEHVPMHTSQMRGSMCVNELINGHPVRCFNQLRMNRNTFLSLCHVLETKYFIDNKAYTPAKERIAWFLRTLSHGCANRDSMERFQRSGSTICEHFGDILDACGRLGADIMKPRDPAFSSVSPVITENTKYYPMFKDCVGALDGCHIELTVPEKDRIRFYNRKGITSTNVLAACDFDLLFVFVLAGWEGSARDTRVYLSAINDTSLNFPKLPHGKYFLGDKGYPDREGLMTPHTRVRYHQSEFRAENPSGPKEIFNKAHSSLRSAIERSFGVLKARWKILRKIPSYPLDKQVNIVNACFILRNYCRLSDYGDPCFEMVDTCPLFIPDMEGHDPLTDGPAGNRVAGNGDPGTNGATEMIALKNELTRQMMERRIG